MVPLTSYRRGCFLVLVPVLLVLGSEVLAGSVIITHIEEPVKVRGKGKLAWRPVDGSDTTVPATGDLLVGEGGALQLRRDTMTLSLNERTGVSLLEGQRADTIRVNHGSTRFSVGDTPSRRRYRITTSNAVIGLRGTVLGVSFERTDLSEVFVDEGLVELKSGGNRVTLSGDSFGRVLRGRDLSSRPIRLRDTVPKRHRLTWDHWRTEARVRTLRGKLQRLNRRLRSIRDGLRTGSLADTSAARRRLDRLQEERGLLQFRLEELSDQYDTVRKRYRSYRRRLERKRKDFIRRRRQALDQFRRRRIRRMKEMQKHRKEGLEEMRERRREAIGF